MKFTESCVAGEVAAVRLAFELHVKFMRKPGSKFLIRIMHREKIPIHNGKNSLPIYLYFPDAYRSQVERKHRLLSLGARYNVDATATGNLVKIVVGFSGGTPVRAEFSPPICVPARH
jgi:hypothetical protein